MALTRAWITLLCLSAVSTLVSLGLANRDLQLAATAGGMVILTLAGLKAYIILSRYLGLHAAPSWRRGFAAVLCLYAVVLLSLYVVA